MKMKKTFNIVFGALFTCFVLSVVTQECMNFTKKVYAEVPAGFTCSLTTNLTKPCQGTCPESKSCKKNSLDDCDCI
jgi:hypothetical protein